MHATAENPGPVQTLFLPSVGNVASLVTTSPTGAQSEKTMTFPDPQAALAWCLQERAGFVMFQVPPAPPASSN